MSHSPVFASSTIFAIAVYSMIFAGGFFEKWGLNHALTLRHYVTAFGAEIADGHVLWTGGAWSSFTTTLTIALVSAPLTAAFGLMVAYLLSRQNSARKGAFEFLMVRSRARRRTTTAPASSAAMSSFPSASKSPITTSN
jgi:iron(III) transport system permease protein